MKLDLNPPNNICCVFLNAKRNECREVSGFFGRYTFSATVHDKNSKQGINGGSVIVLTVWRVSKTVNRISKTINYIHETEKMNYNRGWIIIPHNKKEKQALSAILHCLKRL